jgi:hypothetical protein
MSEIAWFQNSILTSTIGFVQTDFSTAADAFLAWQVPLKRAAGRIVTSEDITGDFEGALQKLHPARKVEPNRMLFAPTTARWTAYFENLATGADVLPAVRQVSSTCRCLGVRVTSVPNTYSGRSRTGRYGATILEIIDPVRGKPPLYCLRSIAAVNDGGRWRFSANGVPQPFEDTSLYDAKKIADRFTVETLERYLEVLGIQAFRHGFYMPENQAILVTEKIPGDSAEMYRPS